MNNDIISKKQAYPSFHSSKIPLAADIFGVYKNPHTFAHSRYEEGIDLDSTYHQE